MDASAALERQSTSDRVREVLIQRILDGTYDPGDRIVELKVAEELDTSQAPVREALKELQGLGFVTAEPYRGTRVREVTETDIREALAVRAVLEEFAARRGMETLGERVGELRSALAAMRAAAAGGEGGDLGTFARHDQAFHRTIVAAAGNGCLLRTWESLGVEIRIRFLLERLEVAVADVAEVHEPIIEAVAAGDSETAAELLRSHPEAIFRLSGTS